MSSPREDLGSRVQWLWASLLPLGLGAWAPLYLGLGVRNYRWCGLGALWSLITTAGWIVAVANNGGALGGLLILLGWGGSVATSFSIRGSYHELMADPGFDTAVWAAEQRLRQRDRARRLALERPEVAREIGVGRPDLVNAVDAGLIDINNAPAEVLATLPGVDTELARRITEARGVTHGFSSIEDLGTALDLDGNLVDQLRAHVVCLPL